MRLERERRASTRERAWKQKRGARGQCNGPRWGARAFLVKICCVQGRSGCWPWTVWKEGRLWKETHENGFVLSIRHPRGSTLCEPFCDRALQASRCKHADVSRTPANPVRIVRPSPQKNACVSSHQCLWVGVFIGGINAGCLETGTRRGKRKRGNRVASALVRVCANSGTRMGVARDSDAGARRCSPRSLLPSIHLTPVRDASRGFKGEGR